MAFDILNWDNILNNWCERLELWILWDSVNLWSHYFLKDIILGKIVELLFYKNGKIYEDNLNKISFHKKIRA